MARQVDRDSDISSKAKRADLDVRYAPYWADVDRGLHLGYRKTAAGGEWLTRQYLGAGKYRRGPVLGVADDLSLANDGAILSFDQARKRALKDRSAGTGPAGPLTCRQAFERYVDYLKAAKKNELQACEARTAFARHAGWLFDKPVAMLSMDDIQRVRDKMVKGDDPERRRRSQASANRVMGSIKAALNQAKANRANNIYHADAWREVKQFRKVAGARQRFLDSQEQKRLINATQGAFRNFVICCLLIGCRPPHELAGLRCRDLDVDAGTLSISDSKTGPRVCWLTEEGIAFFQSLAAGRRSDDILLPMDDGGAWGRNDHLSYMRAAVARAGLGSDVTAYVLRHSYASSALLAGMNIQLLARNIGTSVAMIERHYGKYLDSSVRAHVAQHGPRLGLEPTGKVVRLAKK